MSASQSPSDQNHPTEGESPAQEASDTTTETTECLNCGRVFTGTYCPDCGQEANKELSSLKVLGDFSRELIDTEHGFWHTFKGLTLHPGTTVQRYLQGEHRPFMSPGRYLLVSAVIGGGLTQILQWIVPSTPQRALLVMVAIGFSTGFARGTQGLEVLPTESALAEAHHAAHSSPLRILSLVALAGLTGLLYRALFRQNIDFAAESISLAAYAVGHAVILMSGARFVLGIVFQYWESEAFSQLCFLVPLLFYPGTVTYGCFGKNWWNGIKGALGTLWALLEMAFVVTIGMGGYAGWLLWAHPETYSGGREPVLFVLVAGGIILLLLHGPAFFLRRGNSLR